MAGKANFAKGWFILFHISPSISSLPKRSTTVGITQPSYIRRQEPEDATNLKEEGVQTLASWQLFS